MPTLHSFSLFCLLYPHLFPLPENEVERPRPAQRRGHCFEARRSTLRLMGARLRQRALACPPTGEIWLGVQSLKNLSPLFLHSARHLAQMGYRVTVLGESSATLPPLAPLKVLPLDASAPLRDEWFILVDSAAFRIALCAVALTNHEDEARDPDPPYLALHSRSPSLVESVVAALRAAESARPPLRACG